MLKYLFLLLPFLSFGQQVSSLLWEISGNGLEKPSYLFGTVHRNDKEYFNFSDSVYFALEQVDGIMTESDFFSAFDFYDSRFGEVSYTFDRTGKPFVTSTRTSYTRFGNEKGMPQFMDAYFQQYAENAEKDFYVFRFSNYQKTFNANENIFDFKTSLYEVLKLKNLYLKGELYYLDAYFQKNKSEEVKNENSMLQQQMSLRLDTILKTQRSVFSAVGVEHLSGMIDFLEKLGYTIRNVEANYSDENEVKQRVISYSYYPIEIDSLKLRAVFSGKPEVVKNDAESYEFKLIYREYGQGNTYEIEVYSLKEKTNLNDLAMKYIASPEQTNVYTVKLNNGGEGIEGLSDSYPIGYYWTRILLAEDYFIILKAYGGNLFMGSQRAQRFFQQVELD